MWRSNVVRLRPCSSFSAARSGQKLRWKSSLVGAEAPVSDDEFQKALRAVIEGQEWRSSARLGFAISGGVDSMALAAMYSKARAEDKTLPIGHGFIVDHKVRSNSTEEAEWVAEQLRSKLNMKATILSLTWPKDFDPSDLARFESDARALRYKALGKACKENNINALMVAHHADDQAETVMMRLMNARWRTGLQGMRRIEWIPECNGIHGVHRSSILQKSHLSNTPSHMPFPVEKGGVRILRPLLRFEKTRLVATCENMSIPWAEDVTNQDQTLTVRNTVRHILKNYIMPSALSMKSLMGLSVHMQKRVELHKAFAEQLFDETYMKLDIQTGSLFVRFPDMSLLLDRPITTEYDRNEARNNACYFFVRICELVSPQDNPSLSQLSTAIRYIYPALTASSKSSRGTRLTDSNNTASTPDSFSISNVWWRRWEDNTIPFDQKNNKSRKQPKLPFAKRNPMAFLLSRQPLAESRLDALTQYFPPSKYSNTEDVVRLFDGRYWIRVQNRTSDTLCLRPFCEEDRRNYLSRPPPNQIGTRPDRYIHQALSFIYPSDLRRYLPVLWRIRDSQGPNPQKSIVGFPTLGVRMRNRLKRAMDNGCDWEVRYKQVDFGKRKADEIVIPSIRERHHPPNPFNRKKTSTSSTSSVGKTEDESSLIRHIDPDLWQASADVARRRKKEKMNSSRGAGTQSRRKENDPARRQNIHKQTMKKGKTKRT